MNMCMYQNVTIVYLEWVHCISCKLHLNKIGLLKEQC